MGHAHVPARPCATMVNSNDARAGLPTELWIRSFGFLDARDLFRLGRANRDFLAMASRDSLWKSLCARRWAAKANARRFCVGEEASQAPRDDDDEGDGRVPRCLALARQFDEDGMPPLNMGDGALSHAPRSWKESYILAELDARRRAISRAEIVHFKWRLIYNGAPSKMGLRQFGADGTYSSPYMGACEWVLHGRYLMFAGVALLVERDVDSCECASRLLFRVFMHGSALFPFLGCHVDAALLTMPLPPLVVLCASAMSRGLGDRKG